MGWVFLLSSFPFCSYLVYTRRNHTGWCLTDRKERNKYKHYETKSFYMHNLLAAKGLSCRYYRRRRLSHAVIFYFRSHWAAYLALFFLAKKATIWRRNPGRRLGETEYKWSVTPAHELLYTAWNFYITVHFCNHSTLFKKHDVKIKKVSYRKKVSIIFSK